MIETLNILVVDDEMGDKKLIRRFLAKSRLSCAVYEASTGPEAIAFDAVCPDAVFLDYVLPGQDGLGLLEVLRRKWPHAAFIIMTGQGDEQIAKSAIKAGAADYVSKRAINLNALERMLENGIDTARLQRKLQAQQEELQTFSDVLVHDFRAPIRAVQSLSEQIREDMADGDLEEVEDAIRMLGIAATQMSDLVESLASHIRFDREEDRSYTRAQDIVSRALVSLSESIDESDAQISVQVGDIGLQCSAPQMSQLIQNLVANAIKYCGSSAPSIVISAHAEPHGVVLFKVSDKGIGIPHEFSSRIFEPFKRVPGKDRPQGTGLGLATCRKIVDRHGGTIWCEPDPEGGTIMAFRLPTGTDEDAPMRRTIARVA